MSTESSAPQFTTDASERQLAGVPLPWAYQSKPESQAHMWVRYPAWEVLERCVDALSEGDTFNASWVSLCAGVSATALLTLIPVLLIPGHKTLQTVVIALLITVTVIAAAVAFLIWKIDQREKAHSTSRLQSLKTEMAAIERYSANNLPDEGDNDIGSH